MKTEFRELTTEERLTFAYRDLDTTIAEYQREMQTWKALIRQQEENIDRLEARLEREKSLNT